MRSEKISPYVVLSLNETSKIIFCQFFLLVKGGSIVTESMIMKTIDTKDEGQVSACFKILFVNLNHVGSYEKKK